MGGPTAAARVCEGQAANRMGLEDINMSATTPKQAHAASSPAPRFLEKFFDAPGQQAMSSRSAQPQGGGGGSRRASGGATPAGRVRSSASVAAADQIMSPARSAAARSPAGRNMGSRRQTPMGSGRMSAAASRSLDLGNRSGTSEVQPASFSPKMSVNLGFGSPSAGGARVPTQGSAGGRMASRAGSLLGSQRGVERESGSEVGGEMTSRTRLSPRYAPSPPWSHSHGRVNHDDAQSVSSPVTKSARLSTTSLMGTAKDGPMEPVKTLRRMFEDKSEFVNTYEFLHSLERAPVDWKPEVGTHTTIFHKGFMRKGKDPIPESTIRAGMVRQQRCQEHAGRRFENLAEHTKHHFLKDEEASYRAGGRRHFAETGKILLRGPEHCVPYANDMNSRRMTVMLAEGLVKPRTESVKDVFGHMHGFSASDVQA